MYYGKDQFRIVKLTTDNYSRRNQQTIERALVGSVCCDLIWIVCVMCAHTNRANEELTDATSEDPQHELTDLETERVTNFGAGGVEKRRIP